MEPILPYSGLADLVLVAHLAFILFVAVGGLAVLRWPRLALIHLPVLAYGAVIEVVGWTCPLTPLEKHLRVEAGRASYEGGFIEHYVGGIVYPSNWDDIHVWLGAVLVGFNVALYGLLVWRRMRRHPG